MKRTRSYATSNLKAIRTPFRRFLAVCTGLMLSLQLPAFAQKADPLDKPISIDIPANSPLEDALIQWGVVAGVSVMINTSTVNGQITDGVRGTLSAREVLIELLRHSGLGYAEDGGRVKIAPAASFVRSNMVDQRTGSIDKSSESDIQQKGVPPEDTPEGASENREGRRSSLDEVVVTAQRREERLIDTPTSVTVLDASEMSKLGVTSIPDFGDSVPGMVVNSTGAGNTQITLRGVTTGIDIGATTAIYYDDVPLGPQASFFTPDPSLVDLERIEVLRGPQGTMYGISSMGGLIKYVTKLPDLVNFGGNVQVGASDIQNGGVGYNFAAAVNIPIIDNVLGVRATAFETHDGGYIDNVQLGKSDVNSANTYGGRLDVLFKPTDELSIRLGGLLQRLERKGQATADYDFDGQPAAGALDQIRYSPESFISNLNLVDATVSYNFGPVKLTSISSYQDFDDQNTIDLTPLIVPLLRQYFNVDNYSTVAARATLNFAKVTQELRLASDGGEWVDWVVGAFYSHQSESHYQYFLATDLSRQDVADPGLLTATSPGRSDEVAGFGDLTVHLTKQLDVTGGIRYARVTIASDTVNTGLFSGNGTPYEVASDHVPTYLADARYHLSQDQTAYLRYATGYRPGGPNSVGINLATGALVGPAQYESDSLKSYEVGYKAAFADGRFVLDWDAYHINWSNIQVETSSGIYAFVENAPGGASISGTELALTARPVRDLALSASAAYQDAFLRQASLALGAFAGERLPNVPHLTGTLGADYTFGHGGLEPSVGGSFRYVDARWSSFNDSTYPQYHLPDYAIVDLHGGIHLGSVDGQLYLRNVFNKCAQMAAATGSSPYAQVTIMQPRTIGFNLSMPF